MSPAGWEHYHQLRQESETSSQATILQPEQAAHFSPGQQVTWHHTPRDGYGYVIPVDGVVVKVNKATVTIRVQKRDGTYRDLCVQPTSLHVRASSPEPAPYTGGGRWFLFSNSGASCSFFPASTRDAGSIRGGNWRDNRRAMRTMWLRVVSTHGRVPGMHPLLSPAWLSHL